MKTSGLFSTVWNFIENVIKCNIHDYPNNRISWIRNLCLFKKKKKTNSQSLLRFEQEYDYSRLVCSSIENKQVNCLIQTVSVFGFLFVLSSITVK